MGRSYHRGLGLCAYSIRSGLSYILILVIPSYKLQCKCSAPTSYVFLPLTSSRRYLAGKTHRPSFSDAHHICAKHASGARIKVRSFASLHTHNARARPSPPNQSTIASAQRASRDPSTFHVFGSQRVRVTNNANNKREPKLVRPAAPCQRSSSPSSSSPA